MASNETFPCVNARSAHKTRYFSTDGTLADTHGDKVFMEQVEARLYVVCDSLTGSNSELVSNSVAASFAAKMWWLGISIATVLTRLVVRVKSNMWYGPTVMIEIRIKFQNFQRQYAIRSCPIAIAAENPMTLSAFNLRAACIPRILYQPF